MVRRCFKNIPIKTQESNFLVKWFLTLMLEEVDCQMSLLKSLKYSDVKSNRSVSRSICLLWSFFCTLQKLKCWIVIDYLPIFESTASAGLSTAMWIETSIQINAYRDKQQIYWLRSQLWHLARTPEILDCFENISVHQNSLTRLNKWARPVLLELHQVLSELDQVLSEFVSSTGLNWFWSDYGQ